MERKLNHFVYIILIIIPLKGFFAQDLTLETVFNSKIELSILEKINYQKKHKDSSSINSEVYKISESLKNIGYFTNIIDSIKKKETEYIAYFSLNDKIEKAIIKIDENSKFLFKKLEIKNNFISIPIKKLLLTLSNLSKKLDKEGKSFSKIQLKNIIINDKTLIANLDIYQSEKRIISKVITKGYENFPKSYLKNYFKLKSSTIFNQSKIKEISDASRNLRFISEIKPPEVLFTKDSTLLYIYIKKKQNNSFDGIVNFASKENGDLLFNGNIDLKLNNILNTGEIFELFWNSIGEERQEFKLLAETPYLFNSRITPQISFSLYRQDSTFFNTKFDSKLFYSVNSKTKFALTYNSESSENIGEIIKNNIETFRNYFLGFQFQYNIPKNDLFFNNDFYFEINPTLGKRKIGQNLATQFKIETSISYIWDLNLRNSFFIKNTTGYLNSDNFINNELFRIGGANSIRGFNEQSIFTNNYTYFNLEYRYLTSEKSYLYTITDYGKVMDIDNDLLGLGFGYLFFSNNSQIDLSIVIGKNNSQDFDFNNMKVTLNLKSFF